jgi:type VI secretion system secreted protein VgrG
MDFKDGPMQDALRNLAASGAALFGQNARLLTLRFSEDSRIREESLLPHRLQGKEGLSQNFRYMLDCLSPDGHIELKTLIGLPIEIGLLLPDGGERLFTGIVTAARRGASDGGFCAYTLTIESALAVLAHRRNSRVFQDKSVPEIVHALLDEHLSGNPVFVASFQVRDKLARTYPPRSYCNQYRETDLAFIERLLAEEGITYRFSQGADQDTPIRAGSLRPGEARGTPIVHTLILQDADTLPTDIGDAPIRFHRTDGVETADAIDLWEGERSLQSGAVALESWDYKRAVQLPAADPTAHPGGKAQQDLAATLEDYDAQTAYYGSDPEEMERYARLRQTAKDLAGKRYEGEGTPRHLFPGGRFELADHPVHDQSHPEDRQFIVTGLEFDAQNNLTQDARPRLAGLLGDAAQNRPPYRNRFTALRQDVPIVPDYQSTRHSKPTAIGMTTATVVGPEGEEIYTDEHGRIRIQFHWQRPQDHPQGGANFDDKSSTWVRVAYPAAGAQWGTQHIPRIGQEVVIDFIELDIDRPIVTGVVHNGTHPPPTFSGAGSLPANKTLSGHKSKEVKGGGYNELLFDDSTGEIRTKLSSEHGKTQLNQGFLIHPRTDGKGTPRGEGFELRTDKLGALRAAQGILITAEERGQAVGGQLDRDMLLGQLQAAEGIAKSLSDLSQEHGAETTETEAQSQLLRHVEHWEHGSNTAQKANAAEGGKPIVAVSGPLGIVAATPESVTVTAGRNIDLVSVRHANFSVGGKWLARIKQSLSVFVHELGMKLIAAGGDIDAQAQAGEIRLSAAKRIVLTSNEEIVLQAPKITAIARGARIDLGGGAITTQCSGTHEQKAATHKLTGPGSGAPAGAFDPRIDAYDQKLALNWMGTGAPISNRGYRLKLEDGRTLEGVTDAQGNTETLQSDLAFARYSVELLPEQH